MPPKTLARLTPEECWKSYVGDMSAEDFVRQYDSRDPHVCMAYWLRMQGVAFGIVRKGTWEQTFAAETQPTRDGVAGLLVTYLEERRPEWEAVPISTGPPRDWADMTRAAYVPPPAPVVESQEQALGADGLPIESPGSEDALREEE